jgi:hypothetical protein
MQPLPAPKHLPQGLQNTAIKCQTSVALAALGHLNMIADNTEGSDENKSRSTALTAFGVISSGKEVSYYCSWLT